jgi:hypothetical protein
LSESLPFFTDGDFSILHFFFCLLPHFPNIPVFVPNLFCVWEWLKSPSSNVNVLTQYCSSLVDTFGTWYLHSFSFCCLIPTFLYIRELYSWFVSISSCFVFVPRLSVRGGVRLLMIILRLCLVFIFVPGSPPFIHN